MRKGNKLKLLAAAFWCASIVAGLAAAQIRANSPVATEAPPSAWPAASALRREAGVADFVLFLHPRCACSDASLAELERLLPQMQNRVAAHAIFLSPPDVDPEWTRARLWQKAKSLPGVETLEDSGGREAGLFQATASGEGYLFDGAGALIFHGGLTPSRGHQGDGAGRDIVLSWLKGHALAIREAASFGCRLRKPASFGDAND